MTAEMRLPPNATGDGGPLQAAPMKQSQRVNSDKKPRRAADLQEVLDGRELLVSCRLPPPPGKGIRMVPLGYLHVYSDCVILERPSSSGP